MRPSFAVVFLLCIGRPSSAAPPEAGALAAKIDAHLAARYDAAKIKPAAPADDATFVRRVHLDLAGRIPTVAEIRLFQADQTADKREKMIARLLESGAFTRHSAAFWRREWVPQTDIPRFADLTDQLDDWLVSRVRDGAGYDQIVRDLLTAPRGRPLNGPVRPVTILAASEFKAENLAANITRAFLGVNLDCAQCHDHPFARWTRNQFWETAAFFTPPQNRTFQIAIPGTDKTVTARLLMGSGPQWPAAMDVDAGRTYFANWVTSKDNPYFAKNAVNRLWANIFGIGLVEPLDDLSAENSASHPELLEELANAFTASGFDLKHLTRAMMLSRAYQRSSVAPDPASDRLFARMPARGLTGEQLYDSLRVAAGLPVERDDLDPLNAHRERKRFAEKFRIDRAGTAQRSILQSLSLMNGPMMSELTDARKTPALRAVAEAPFLDTKGKVEAIFLGTLGRGPSESESGPLVKYIAAGGADGDPKKALGDVFWALLMSTEFNTNH